MYIIYPSIAPTVLTNYHPYPCVFISYHQALNNDMSILRFFLGTDKILRRLRTAPPSPPIWECSSAVTISPPTPLQRNNCIDIQRLDSGHIYYTKHRPLFFSISIASSDRETIMPAAIMMHLTIRWSFCQHYCEFIVMEAQHEPCLTQPQADINRPIKSAIASMAILSLSRLRSCHGHVGKDSLGQCLLLPDAMRHPQQR